MPAAGGMGLRQEEKTKEKQLIELICGAERERAQRKRRQSIDGVNLLMKSIDGANS